MARARARPDRNLTEIADAILAEWYRVMPPTGQITEADIQRMDMASLSAAFTAVVEEGMVCRALLDGDGSAAKPLLIVVPRPPAKTRDELDQYVRRNQDFRSGMGAAVLFACGR